MNVVQVSGRGLCGASQWAAAKESSKKSSSKLDEEGLEIAVCRHGILLTALNMFRGEIFAYPLFLQKKLAEKSQGTIQFFCSDVACKYFPYLQRVSKNCPELQSLLDMRPFLSVMHAKAHSWKCEVHNHASKYVKLRRNTQPPSYFCCILKLRSSMVVPIKKELVQLLVKKWSKLTVSYLGLQLPANICRNQVC